MFKRMLFGDSVKFGGMYLTILMGFSSAIYAQFSHLSESEIEGTSAAHYNMLHEVILAMFRTSLGDFNYDFVRYAGREWLTVIVWLLFTVLSTIILLNMLIAMMSETFVSLRSDARERWKLLRAIEVVNSESGTFAKLFFEWWHGKDLVDIRPTHYISQGQTWEMVVQKQLTDDDTAGPSRQASVAGQSNEALTHAAGLPVELLDNLNKLSKHDLGRVKKMVDNISAQYTTVVAPNVLLERNSTPEAARGCFD